MNITDKEYLLSLVPEELPDWRQLAEEGRKIGEGLEVNKTRFLKEKGCDNLFDYKLKRLKEGELTWQTIMGLASLDDQVKGHEYLDEFGKRTGVVIDSAMVIANMLTAIPEDKRANAPKGTSFVLEKYADYEDIAEAASIQPCFNDFHIGTPNSVECTKNAIRVGSSYIGVLAQFTWDYPGCSDDIKNMSETVKAISMIASRYDEKFAVDTYLDDGIPSYMLDLASYMGYALLEKYIVTELCGARYVVGFGQLMDKTIPKVSILLALSDLLKQDDQPGVSYIFSNTIDHWDHDLEANYGFLCTEVLMEVLVEKKYKTGVSILPIPITEKVAVPTPQSIANIHAASRRVAEKAEEWEDLMDYTKIEETRDILKERGVQFYNNVINGLKEAGVDVTDPLRMLLLLKRISPIKLEQLFHQSILDGSDDVKPYVPTSMAKRSIDTRDEIVENINSNMPTAKEKISDRKILVLSGDGHWYGQFVVAGVLSKLGADVVDGGVGMDAIDVLDLADEVNVSDICISVHNGQALDYAKQLMELSKDRENDYRFFMGGKLNGIVDGNSEPIDVTDRIEAVGVYTSDTVEELVEKLI